MAALTGNVVITHAGEAAMLAGTLDIQTVRLGTGIYTPVDTLTGLQTEVAAVSASGVVLVNPAGGYTLRVNGIDTSGATYDVHEFSLADDQGAALFIYSQSAIIATKGAGSDYTFAINIAIDDAAAGSITISGDTNYFLPFADTASAGIIETALDVEAIAATSTQHAITPANLSAAGLQNQRLTVRSETATDSPAVFVAPKVGEEWALSSRQVSADGRFVRTYTRIGLVGDDYDVLSCQTQNAKFHGGLWSKDINNLPASRVAFSSGAGAFSESATISQWVPEGTDVWNEGQWLGGASLDHGLAGTLSQPRTYGRAYRDNLAIVDCLIQMGPTANVITGGNVDNATYSFGGTVCNINLFAAGALPNWSSAKVHPTIQSSIAGKQFIMGQAAGPQDVLLSIYDLAADALVVLSAAGSTNIKVAVRVTCGE